MGKKRTKKGKTGKRENSGTAEVRTKPLAQHADDI